MNNEIVCGPVTYQAAEFQAGLFRVGFVLELESGVFFAPSGAELTLPAEAPAAPLALEGCSILPAVEVDEPAPEGKVLAGREPVIMADRVELRPVWVDAPPSPSLDSLRAQAITEIKAGAYRYIVARYPEWQQNNAACAVINSLVTGQANPQAMEDYAAMRTYIDDARIKSNEAEALVRAESVDTPEKLATVMEAIRAQYAADIPA